MKQKSITNKSSERQSKKKSSISIIIATAYQRTKDQFMQSQQIHLQRSNRHHDRVKKKRLTVQKEATILIEEEQKPIEAPMTAVNLLEQINTRIRVDPLIDLKANSQKAITLDDIKDQIYIDLDYLMKLQERIWRERVKERKQQQFDRFKFYDQLTQEEKLRDIDNQIKEDFSYTYTFGNKSSIEIKYVDFTNLNALVNDTIINFFLRYCLHELVEQPSRFFILSTYHTAKIVPWEYVSTLSSTNTTELVNEFGRNLNTILKWTKDDTFNSEFLLLPLHLKEHWSLMVVCDAKDVCQQMLQGSTKNQPQGFFLYLDSIQELDDKILFLLKMFLLQMYCTQQNISLTQDQIVKAVKTAQVQCYQPLVPRQINYVDCGVHVLEYAERFMIDPDMVLQRLKSPQWWLLLDWFPRIMVITKRLLIKRLLLNLIKFDKAYATSTYVKETKNILYSFKEKPNEFDQFDQEEFEEFAADKQVPLQILRLVYYQSEEYNFYFSD